MSSLLDALEKAKRERGSDAVRLSEFHAEPPRKSRVRWLVLVLVVFILGIVGYWQYYEYYKACGDCSEQVNAMPQAPEMLHEDASNVDSSQDISSLYEPSVLLISQLTPNLRASLPSMQYQAHVYSQETGQGFVMINAQRLTVGGFVGTAQIQEIDDVGVIFQSQGIRFRLLALEDFDPSEGNESAN